MGIRNKTLSNEDTPKKKTYTDPYYDYYGSNYGNNYPTYHSTQPKKNYNAISITVKIPYTDIGNFTDYSSQNYNPTKSEEIATSKAEEKIETYFGKDVNQRFHTVYKANDTYMDYYEVEIEMIPK